MKTKQVRGKISHKYISQRWIWGMWRNLMRSVGLDSVKNLAPRLSPRRSSSLSFRQSLSNPFAIVEHLLRESKRQSKYLGLKKLGNMSQTKLKSIWNMWQNFPSEILTCLWLVTSSSIHMGMYVSEMHWEMKNLALFMSLFSYSISTSKVFRSKLFLPPGNPWSKESRTFLPCISIPIWREGILRGKNHIAFLKRTGKKEVATSGFSSKMPRKCRILAYFS